MDHDRELLRLWNIVSEITEQLQQNKAITSKLLANSGQLKEQTSQTAEQVTLRRFNTDLSKEHFTSELERLSVVLVMENQSLLHENKQLNSLMHEYEQTLETVMNKFRGHCQAAQTHQLTLSKHYETLLSREKGDESTVARGMDADHLDTLSTCVKKALRSIEGKDPLQEEKLERHAQALEATEEGTDGEEKGEPEDMGDWAVERETEIRRLEQENAELRRTLGISQEQGRELSLEEPEPITPSAPSHSGWCRRTSFSRPPSFRGDRGRGGGRLPLGLPGSDIPQRRSGLPVFMRRNFGDVGSSPERVASPPNDVRWGREATSGPLVESI